MPRLRRLNGQQVIAILEQFGFRLIRVRGNHTLQRSADNKHQNLTVPVHGNDSLALGPLKNIYRQACVYISEEDLKTHFYTD